ncbi:MAG: DNA-binding protein [Clostridia bacterium]|nr:DNA-binding protein [Clostridia bacterium]
MPRMRTIQEAAAELKKLDPDTAVTAYAIRQMVLNNDIPHIKAGKKHLINMDTLEKHLSCAI